MFTNASILAKSVKTRTNRFAASIAKETAISLKEVIVNPHFLALIYRLVPFRQ